MIKPGFETPDDLAIIMAADAEIRDWSDREKITARYGGNCWGGSCVVFGGRSLSSILAVALKKIDTLTARVSELEAIKT